MSIPTVGPQVTLVAYPTRLPESSTGQGRVVHPRKHLREFSSLELMLQHRPPIDAEPDHPSGWATGCLFIQQRLPSYEVRFVEVDEATQSKLEGGALSHLRYIVDGGSRVRTGPHVVGTDDEQPGFHSSYIDSVLPGRAEGVPPTCLGQHVPHHAGSLWGHPQLVTHPRL